MTTETKTEKTETETPAASDNKAVFGPLGKYAAVAVIMVSIIVTTAIMLDRQLQSVDEQIAAIEDEVASIHAAENNTPETTAVVVTTVAGTEVAEVEVIEEVANETVAVVETYYVETPAVAKTVVTPVAEAPVAQQTTPAVAAAVTEPVQASPTTQFEMAAAKNNAAQARQQQLAKENQARIGAYKQEQKQHMTAMFARIKTLESQQLDRYKANQDSQIVHLRKQISQQQQMIEALVLRNKKLFELRAASMQRTQNNREQVLNRI